MDNDGPFTANIWPIPPRSFSTPSFHGQRDKIRTNCHCVIRTPKNNAQRRHIQIVLLTGCRGTCVCFQFTTVGSCCVYITSYRLLRDPEGLCDKRSCLWPRPVTTGSSTCFHLADFTPRALMHSKSGFVSPAETTQLWSHIFPCYLIQLQRRLHKLWLYTEGCSVSLLIVTDSISQSWNHITMFILSGCASPCCISLVLAYS